MKGKQGFSRKFFKRGAHPYKWGALVGNFKRRPILEAKLGEEITCNAFASKSPTETTQGITCIGKLADGRVVLFDKQASLSRVIKPGDKIRGKIVHVKPTYVIVQPESIVEQASGEVPEGSVRSSKWDSSLIESIRRKKEAERNPDLEYLLKLISKELYGGEKTHYILELIQNADDEDAKGLSFTAYADRVEVWNDGEAFTSEDVENICSARSAKRNKIGFFGVGFKSVFNITDNPQIISGKYNFQIENFIYPAPCFTKPPPDFSPERGAWFILPYNSKNRNTGNIENIMQAVNEKALLFLPHLKEIVFLNTVSGNKWYLEKKESEEGVVSLFNSSTNTYSQWRVFIKDLDVLPRFQVVDADTIKQRPRKTRIAVAFPVPDNGKMLDVSAEPVYCYLPTQKRTDMPFLIQGDFDPTVGRENIKDNEWNQWLLAQVGKLAVEGYEAIKDKVQHETLFRYVPLDEEVKEHLLRVVYDNLLNEIKACSIAPADDKRWILPAKIVIDSENGALQNLIGADITKLKGEGVGYLALSAGERGRSVLAQLDARKIVTNDLIEYVQKTELIEKRISKGLDWFLQLYVYLSKEFDQTDIQYNEDSRNRLERLKSSKIIVTARNKLIAIKSENAKEIVIFYPHKINLDEEYAAFSDGEVDFISHYFQKDTILRRKSVDKELEEARERAKAFLTLLGIRLYYDEYTLINDVICKRLQKPNNFSQDKIIAYTNFMLEKLDRYVSLAENKYQTSKTEEQILENLGDKLNVCVFYSGEANKPAKYIKASEAYFSKFYGYEFLEELFAGLPEIPFLSDIYVKPGEQKKWREFFEKVGVWKSPKIVQLEETRIHFSDSKFNWVPFTSGAFYGTHSLEGDWVSPDLEKLFEFSKSQSDESKLQRFKQLWKMLDDNWSKTYQKARSCTYAYTPVSRSQTKKVDKTSFLNMLLTNRWVPASDGSLSEPTALFTDTERNRTLLGNSVKYVALEGRQSFIKDLNIKENPTKTEVANHLRQLKSEGIDYTKETLGKLEAIYGLLVSKTDQPSDDEIKENQEIEKIIHDDELVYIPRKDKEWWNPEQVFWKDQNSIFGKTRGYLSTFYSRGAIQVFEKIGIKEACNLKDCLKVLEELASSPEIDDTTRAIINNVYLECERLLGIGIKPEEENQVFQNLKLLVKPKAEKQSFIPVSGIVFADNELLEINFADTLEILWLGCAYSEVPNLLSTFKISPISSLVAIEIKPIDVVDAKPTVVQTIRDWQYYLNQWIKYRKPKLYKILSEGLEKLGTIDILEAQEIALHLRLKSDPNISKIIKSDVYYDNLSNKLYISAITSPYAPRVASELCRVFPLSEVMKEPILNLSSAGEDNERRIEIFQQFGIPKEGLPNLVMEQIEAKQIQEQKSITVKAAVPKEEPEKEEEEKTVNVPPQQIVQLGPFLIDPEDYSPDEIDELEPSSPPEGAENSKNIVRAVKKVGPVSRQRTVKVTLAPQMPEDVALDLAKKFEQSEGRSVDDSPRDQKNVGYDFTSADGKSKRFVEIKSSRFDEINITLQQSEWRKAELEGENYYIYVITGLRAGGYPKLRILQNPIKYLKPDLPSNIIISKWKHAVRFEVSFSKNQDSQTTVVGTNDVNKDEK
jgi:hypothetical protein